jgi:5'-nucleotidase
MNSLLRNVMQCDFVIALTHMRLSNDRILANSVPEIDLVLGGQDHGYNVECDSKTGVFIVKSRANFDDFSDIDLQFNIDSD